MRQNPSRHTHFPSKEGVHINKTNKTNEVPEGQRIKVFVTMGCKNYSYDLEDIASKKFVGRVTKMKGLTFEILEVAFGLKSQNLDLQ